MLMEGGQPKVRDEQIILQEDVEANMNVLSVIWLKELLIWQNYLQARDAGMVSKNYLDIGNEVA